MSRDRQRVEEEVLQRFIRYAKVDTTAIRHQNRQPSNPNQLELQKMLAYELEEIGVKNQYSDEHGFLIGRLAARNTEKKDTAVIGLMAHMDTAPDLSGKNVNPIIHKNYDGLPIELGARYVLNPADYPELNRYKGETIITTDGSTLLGADNKAGIAEIMTALHYLHNHPGIPHPKIEVIFTTDEELGTGMDSFPLDAVESSFCYTVDGGEEGIVEAECFSAYKVRVKIHGYSIHPGTARGKLANAVTIAGKFLSMLPQAESPEATDGRYGFYCPIETAGGIAESWIDLIIRDFDIKEVERRIDFLRSAAASLEKAYPGSSIELDIAKQYFNMKDSLDKHPEVLDYLLDAIRETGMEPKVESIRGGTDGARLAEMGIPSPNIFTGGHNFHGRYEWIALPGMLRAAKTIVNLLRIWASHEESGESSR